MHKFILILICLFLFGCTKTVQEDIFPKYKTLQVNYIENKQEKYLFLIVKETAPSEYIVLREEYSLEAPTFLITEIFDYDSR